MDNIDNDKQMLQDAPAKVEKISLEEIKQEHDNQKKEKTDELVEKVMEEILKIE